MIILNFISMFLIFFMKATLCINLDDLNVKDSSQVGVRAVYIDCEMNENKLSYDGSDSSRFQREELFKHNSLRNCKKKLVLTLKMVSDSSQPSSDEYIPVEHVFDGPNKKRVRLLNPYILRLRRDPPFETYKLRDLDIFSALFKNPNKEQYQSYRKMTKVLKNRYKRNLKCTGEDWFVSRQFREKSKSRSEENNEKRKINELHYNQKINSKNKMNFRANTVDLTNKLSQDDLELNEIFDSNRNPMHNIKLDNENNYNMLNDPVVINDNINFHEIKKSDSFHSNKQIKAKSISASKNVSENMQSGNFLSNLDGTEKKITIFEIGEPVVSFRAQLQLFEKLSTPEGKSIWKDLSDQESAHISSSCREWANQDLNIRYRCSERISREDFTLPSAGICLLLPQNDQIRDGITEKKFADFLIVPEKDIETIEERGKIRRDKNITTENNGLSSEVQDHRRILVRLTRAIFVRNEDGFRIKHDGTDKYLRIPYKQPHHAQIDVEAKADDNQLVYIGSSGRLSTAVSESTRRDRAILTVLAANTGLAAARFRPIIRECGPEIKSMVEEGLENPLTPILIPPMHTHTFRLELPLEMPGETTQCLVALLNDGDESVAVRDVRIKKDDRCFCVWHCQCVCLTENPKLVCQEMAEHQQTAAGLSPRDRPRLVRAACYTDVVPVNLLVIFLGVILLLLAIGLLKACVGLFVRRVGTWGIDQLLQSPRRLNRYYESNLRSRTVVFDEDGWPLHPDTKERTVRLISKPTEFVLNVIFFVILPCLVLWSSLKKVITRCKKKHRKGATCEAKTHMDKCPEQEIQEKNAKAIRWRRGRRKQRLSRWMSPHAEELSTVIWRNGLAIQGLSKPASMQSLLREERSGRRFYKPQSPIVDSEQDDTEYVLMQMQNSRDSLSENKQKDISTRPLLD